MAEILNYLGVAGFAVILLSVFIEITPIKINPIQWLGSQLFAGLRKDVKVINDKLDEHIAQSYRDKIMSFQNELLNGQLHTQEEFDEVIDACDDYEEYIRTNALKNGKANAAIAYIRRMYNKCLDERAFINLSREEK